MTEETKVLMQRVLQEYLKQGVIGPACDSAGVARKKHYEWLETSARYKELYDEITEKFWDGMEQVAIDRAREKSDTLLMFLLKANRREKYGDKQDISLKNGEGKSGITLVFAEGMLSPSEKEMLGGPVNGSTESET